jgi:hypothetical protein
MQQRNHSAWIVLVLAAATGARGFDYDPRTNEIKLASLTGFDNCVLDLSEIPGCLAALRQLANRRPNDAFQAGKRAAMYYAAWTPLPFFEIAFRKQATDAQCSDEDVLTAVVAGLSRPSSDQESIELARNIAAGKCWESLQEGLTAAVEAANASFKSNACPLFAAKGVTIELCTAVKEPTRAAQ